MINLHTIRHQIGLFNKPLASQKIFEAVVSGGLLSRHALEDKGIIPKSNMTGLFSDEHDNIYFWATLLNLEYTEDYRKQDYEEGINRAITVKVFEEDTYVYNAILRGDVDYFAYQASRLSLSHFLQLHQEYDDMKERHPDKNVMMHYITGQPLLVRWLAYKEYQNPAEIPIHVSYINSDLITIREHPHMFRTSVLKCAVNGSFPILHSDPYKTRGICTNEDCSLVTIPSKFNVPDILGTKSLLTPDGSRSRSVPIKVITLKEFSSSNYKLDFTKAKYTPCLENSYANYDLATNHECSWYDLCCWIWYRDANFRIKGDDRDNTISLLLKDNYKAIITGGKGADLFCMCPFAEDDIIQITIVDFNAEEGDRLCLPENVKNSQVWKADTEISIFVPNAFSAIILPGQTTPIKSAIMTDCSCC